MTLTDRKHFESIFKEHYNALCNYVKQIVEVDSIAEDIVQDVFVHLWKQRASLEVKDSLVNYLITSCRNKALEQKRKKKRLNKAPLDLKTLAYDEETIYSEAKNLILKEKIYCSIRQLPTKCGQVFTLSKIDGLTYAEIAERLEVSVKTVENHMTKAFKLLKVILEKEDIPR